MGQELGVADVLGTGGEDGDEDEDDASEHPGATLRGEDDAVGDGVEEEGRRRSGCAKAGGGGAVASYKEIGRARKGPPRAAKRTLSSEHASADPSSSSFGADVSSSSSSSSNRAWIRVPAPGKRQPRQQHQGVPQVQPQPQHGRRHDRRLVPSQCAICLSSMARGEKVTWSSNPNCLHVFHHRCGTTDAFRSGVRVARTVHLSLRARRSRTNTHSLCGFSLAAFAHSCILVWLEASSTKERERRLRRQANSVLYPEAAAAGLDKLDDAVPLPCPCCRQEFVLEECQRPDDKEDDDRRSGSSNGADHAV
jgi:hypothetical protein